MGACITTMTGVAPPSIDFPAEKVSAKCTELLEPLPEKYDETLAAIKEEFETHKKKDPDSDWKKELEKAGVLGTVACKAEEEEAEKQLKNIAGKVLAKGEFAANIAAEVWTTVEPDVDAQRPEGTPDMVWDTAKEQLQGKVEEKVGEQVEGAVDKHRDFRQTTAQTSRHRTPSGGLWCTSLRFVSPFHLVETWGCAKGQNDA
eukprot:1948567-Rhodomonas_salina.1